MPPKTVASLLAQQDETVLTEMRESIEAEISRLQMELSLVMQALGSRRRRPSRGTAGSTARAFSGVKRSDVLAIVAELEPPVAPAEVRQQLQLRGVTISGAAVRNHLRRLVRDGELRTVGDGAYVLAINQLPRTASDDPLSTASQTPSWEHAPAGASS